MSRIDFNGLDTVVHGPIRLGVLTALQVDGAQDFTTLKKRLSVTDGAMGAHLKKLVEAGYVGQTRAFVGQRPKTTYRLTKEGRAALGAYVRQMRELLASVED